MKKNYISPDMRVSLISADDVMNISVEKVWGEDDTGDDCFAVETEVSD